MQDDIISYLLDRKKIKELEKKLGRLEREVNGVKVTEPLADEAAEALGRQKGEAMRRFMDGPLKKATMVTVGVMALAQILDSADTLGDRLNEPRLAQDEAKAVKQREKQRLAEEEIYEEEMEEAYNKGLFLDYTEDATKNMYKPLGYQPGLPGDPNLNLVQSLYEKRNNHTRM